VPELHGDAGVGLGVDEIDDPRPRRLVLRRVEPGAPGRDPAPILICGSLHFAGEALAFLRGEPAALEDCLQ